MTTLIETIPALAGYVPAFIGLAILCLIVLIQSLLTAPMAFLIGEQAPGLPLQHGHTSRSFRVMRTYANSVENLPAFGFALFCAIVAGASPVVVNWLVMIHLAFRLIYWTVYYAGIGKVAGGPRTMAYVGGFLANLGLVLAALYALLLAL